MIANLTFWISLALSLGIGFLYFRDLGDVTQMLVRVKRENMIRFIRHEYRLIAVGLTTAVIWILLHVTMDTGPAWLFWSALALTALLYGFPWVWVHLGLRHQIDSARFFPIEEAKAYVAPASQVLVMEHNGVARAHPDHELMRPHLAGNAEGLNGENVVMTYCALANLGVGYTPEIAGQPLELEVLAQHGNNLILRDNVSGQPIQHIHGRLEDSTDSTPGMKPYPTFRMTFRAFQKAYPDGEVFLNKPATNPLLRLLDLITETAFSGGIARQHRQEAPVMDNMTRSDNRLANKTYVWGINIGNDAVCYTEDFLIDRDNLINVTIGSTAIVVARDPGYESIGAWYNTSGTPVQEISFFGASDQGQLARVETLKPGMFWHVWAEFFPHTDINRSD